MIITEKPCTLAEKTVARDQKSERQRRESCVIPFLPKHSIPRLGFASKIPTRFPARRPNNTTSTVNLRSKSLAKTSKKTTPVTEYPISAIADTKARLHLNRASEA